MKRRAIAEPDRSSGAVVFLGLGSNIGNRVGMLRQALHSLTDVVAVDAASDVYQSEPWGWTDQPRFLNMVVRGRTRLDPLELLHAVKDVELRLGRTATVRMGPRVIDIDVLLYGGLALEQDELTIPHPGILQRPFVLVPLLDIDADLVHPVTGTPLKAALAPLRAEADTMSRLGPIDTLPENDNATA